MELKWGQINCFGTETDREEQKGTCGSHFQFNKKKQNKTKVMKIKSFTGRDGERETVRFFFIFSFKSSFFDSRVSDRRISSGQT